MVAKKPVRVGLSGGLGNQLFQYAAGRSLAARLNTSLELDVSHYGAASNKRQFELQPLSAYFTQNQNRPPLQVLQKLHKLTKSTALLNGLLHRLYSEIEWERDIGYDPRWTAISHPKYLHGVWMSERYFAEHAHLITQDFAPFLQPPKSEIAVHIRLTDYLTIANAGKFKGSCDAAYYAKAIAQFCGNDPNASFLIFSDDKQAAKSMLPSKITHRFHDDSGETPFDTLMAMAACQHHIIANSTFSWWAAWLNRNPSKTVIAPRHWFSPAYERKHNMKDIVPATWQRMDGA
jgi:hypothetical protein